MTLLVVFVIGVQAGVLLEWRAHRHQLAQADVDRWRAEATDIAALHQANAELVVRAGYWKRQAKRYEQVARRLAEMFPARHQPIPIPLDTPDPFPRLRPFRWLP